MTNVNNNDIARLNANFIEEYNSHESTRKYTRKTAGHGISYLLDHDYKRVYLECIEKYVPKSRLKEGLRLWEFGCGGGMNVLYLMSVLGQKGIRVDRAYGTDFSETLITAARNEARDYLESDQRKSARFAVARNENLIDEGAKGLNVEKKELIGSFDIVFGVNTIRYGHRLNNVDRCVEGIRSLLREGGVCIVIDMNRKFPAFRSRLREMLTRPAEKEETLLPTLEEYARPFSSAGFEILTKKNFCWIPHSAGAGLTTAMRTLTPVLNTVARSRAMRSLVIARKLSRVSK